MCEALIDPWHALETAQGFCANILARPSLHAALHDGASLQQPVDGSSVEPTLPDPCCHQKQPQGGQHSRCFPGGRAGLVRKLGRRTSSENKQAQLLVSLPVYD